MNNDLREKVLVAIDTLDEIAEKTEIEISETLNSLSKEIIPLLSISLKKPAIDNGFKWAFGEVLMDNSPSFGLYHTEEKIIVANWILDLQHNTKRYLLILFLIKGSIKHFIKLNYSEEDEAILNIISIVLLTDVLGINTLDNPMLSALRAKIYSEEIAGVSLMYWDNLLILLISKDIPFTIVFDEFFVLLNDDSKSNPEKVKLFFQWVISTTVKEEDVISPIYTNKKLIDLIETLFELGYEKSSTSIIAKKDKLSQKTITKRFKALNENYSTHWNASINYEEMNLHNYFVKITTMKDIFVQKINSLLLTIPYLKSLYNGYGDESRIIYSPSLICPHIISEQLRARLRKMKDSGLISDYTIQLVREKYRYFAITNFPYNPKPSTFMKLINHGDQHLKKFTFSHEKRSSVIPISDKPVVLDYNLLYFLSVLTGKYLLQARYAVNINEFKKFCLEKNISMTDIKSQTDLLYQYELRARRKGLLSFTLFMRNFRRFGSDVLVFELPIVDEKMNGKLQTIIDKLRIFAFMGQINLYDRVAFQIPGISHQHPLQKIIEEVLTEAHFSPSFYTIKLHKSKYVPLHELYDYDNQKWKITDI